MTTPLTKTWHGKTYEEVMATWDEVPWRQAIVGTLLEIGTCRHAAAEDRLGALTLLNNAITADVLPAMPEYPALLRSVMMTITVDSRAGWFRARSRRRMAERLVGARAALAMVHQFQAIIAEREVESAPVKSGTLPS